MTEPSSEPEWKVLGVIGRLLYLFFFWLFAGRGFHPWSGARGTALAFKVPGFWCRTKERDGYLIFARDGMGKKLRYVNFECVRFMDFVIFACVGIECCWKWTKRVTFCDKVR